MPPAGPGRWATSTFRSCRRGSAAGSPPTCRPNRENSAKGELMNSVVHFEMPFDDRDRMARFYRTAFGWQTRMLGEEMGNYVLATTTETDEKGPRKPGAINGGFYPKKSGYPAQYPSVVIAVDDIQAAATKVAEAGGKV